MDNELTDDERIEGELRRAGAELRGWGPGGDGFGASVEPVADRRRRPVLVPIAASLTLLAGVAGVAAVVSANAAEPVPVSVASGDVGGETAGPDDAGTNAAPGEGHSGATVQDAERAVFASDVVALCDNLDGINSGALSQRDFDLVDAVPNVTSWFASGGLVIGLDRIDDAPLDWASAERSVEPLQAAWAATGNGTLRCYVSPGAETRASAFLDSVNGEVVTIARNIASSPFIGPESAVQASPGQAIVNGVATLDPEGWRITTQVSSRTLATKPTNDEGPAPEDWQLFMTSNLDPSEFEIIEP